MFLFGLFWGVFSIFGKRSKLFSASDDVTWYQSASLFHTVCIEMTEMQRPAQMHKKMMIKFCKRVGKQKRIMSANLNFPTLHNSLCGFILATNPLLTPKTTPQLPILLSTKEQLNPTQAFSS